MRDLFIEFCIKKLKKKNELSNLDEISCRYALYTIYSSVTKISTIIIISLLLNMFIETMFLLIIYGIIRFFGAGLHASNNLYCWLTTIPIYIVVPLLIKYVEINNIYYYSILTVTSLLMFYYAPADTEKRPIIREHIRKRNQKLLIVTVLILTIVTIIINNSILANTLLFAVIIECVCVNPLTYKLFRKRYKNYLYHKPLKV